MTASPYFSVPTSVLPGRPRIADVERLRGDVHSFAEVGDGDAGFTGVVAVIGDSGGEDGVVIILLDALKGAEEHGHGFLPGGGAGRVEDDAAGGVFCAVDIAVGHTELRGFLCPAGKGRGIAKLAEGVGVDGQDGLKGGGIAEVFEELEKFLPRDALIGSERAVRITGDDAVFIGLGDVSFVSVKYCVPSSSRSLPVASSKAWTARRHISPRVMGCLRSMPVNWSGRILRFCISW